ncbi:MAG TPA: diguanylate cyclase [Stenomitos sp.]
MLAADNEHIPPALEGATPPEPPRRRLLVIDDAEEMRLVLQALLGQAGYEDVQIAESFESAQTLLSERTADGRSPLDLILLDLMMPDVDGIEACRRIRSDRALDDTPIIVITAKTGSHDIEQAFQAGAMDFIRKPIDRVELMARIRSALRLKQELDTVKAHERTLVELMTQLQEANGRLERLSTHDALTGIPNRRAFDEFLARELRRGARKGHPVSLIMLDIDFFKAYNDRYGHLAGDACLVAVARAIARVAQRPGDLAARYGGEEFALVLADTPLERAEHLAAKIQQNVAALALPHAQSSCAPYVTLSMGIASLDPKPSTTAEDLIGAADRALYSAKAGGRNRFMTASTTLA